MEREPRAGGKQVQCEAEGWRWGWGGGQQEGRRGGKVTLGAQAKGKEGKFVLGGSHLEDSRAGRGGAVCHSKETASKRKRDKCDIGV